MKVALDDVKLDFIFKLRKEEKRKFSLKKIISSAIYGWV